jgi:serine/threonine protein kinase
LPEQTISHYEVLEPLGEGGMGVVYKARDTRLDRHVAIKVIRPEYSGNPMARERFRREAVSAAAVDHPFLCKVFEIGEEAGALFIVMEFIPGETIHTRLSRGPLGIQAAVRIASEIAEALEEAHGSNLVHRDLKPANVMLTTQGRVKVMDFGLAKRIAGPTDTAVADGHTLTIAEAQLTSRGIAVGTPDYMSPE